MRRSAAAVVAGVSSLSHEGTDSHRRYRRPRPDSWDAKRSSLARPIELCSSFAVKRFFVLRRKSLSCRQESSRTRAGDELAATVPLGLKRDPHPCAAAPTIRPLCPCGFGYHHNHACPAYMSKLQQRLCLDLIRRTLRVDSGTSLRDVAESHGAAALRSAGPELTGIRAAAPSVTLLSRIQPPVAAVPRERFSCQRTVEALCRCAAVAAFALFTGVNLPVAAGCCRPLGS